MKSVIGLSGWLAAGKRHARGLRIAVGVWIVMLAATAVLAQERNRFIDVRLGQGAPGSQADNRYCAQTGRWTGGVNDGPALLPEDCFNTAAASTPAPGGVIHVAAGADLQEAYEAARCGQVLLLAHGATWQGPFNFAAKNCPDTAWIWVMTDGALPAEGSRIDPAADRSQMATFTVSPGASPSTFGDHLRFVGIAWTKQPGHALTEWGKLDGGNKVIFDRNYFHGNAREETRRALGISNSNYVALIDSYVDEIHCIALTGSCLESQAISGGLDSKASGPFKIVNNFLEAASQNIFFGGGAASFAPCDIEIRRNDLYKQLSWNPMDPSFGGVKYVVKNHFELKNACRVLFEGNTAENNWGGFTQSGFSVVIGPKNQAAQGVSVCPNCQTHDITMRYNHFSTTGGTFEIGTGTSDTGGWAMAAYGYSIHDDLFEHVQYAECYECGNNTGQLGSGYSAKNPPPASLILHDVLVNHITVVTDAFPRGGAKGETAMLVLNGPPAGNPTHTPQIRNVQWMNSIFASGSNGFFPSGGGADNCSVGKKTLERMIAACWAGVSGFTGNVVVGAPGETIWPSGNLFAATWQHIQFGGSSLAYALSSDSLFRGRALDGLDPGANMALIREYAQGPVQTTRWVAAGSGQSLGVSTGAHVRFEPAAQVSYPSSKSGRLVWEGDPRQ